MDNTELPEPLSLGVGGHGAGLSLCPTVPYGTGKTEKGCVGPTLRGELSLLRYKGQAGSHLSTCQPLFPAPLPALPVVKAESLLASPQQFAGMLLVAQEAGSRPWLSSFREMRPAEPSGRPGGPVEGP